MFITRKKYEEDLERAHEEGRQEAFREMNEAERETAKERAFDQLRREVSELRWQVETKTAAKTIPAVEKGVTCPPDRLDI